MTASGIRHLEELDEASRVVAGLLARTLPGSLAELGVQRARALLDTPPGRPPFVTLERVERLALRVDGGHEVELRLYRPAGTQSSSPALLYLHGGGFVLGTLDGADDGCRALASASGWAVLSIAYRLAPEAPYPAALDDAVAAFRWLRERAPALDLSPDHLAIGGDSAGGNLATCCCLRLQELGEPGPAGQVLVYPAVDDTFDRPSWRRYADAPGLTAADARWCWQQYLGPAAGRPAAPFAAPMRAPSLRGLPPALVLTATVDPLRDDVDAYAERLRADGVPVIAKRYPGVFHGFFTEVRTFDRARKAVADVAAFLRELVG